MSARRPTSDDHRDAADARGRRILFMFEALAVQAEPIFLAFEYAQ